MRKLIDLFESEDCRVVVTIESYVGVADDQLGLPPFPAALTVEIESDLDQDQATLAIKEVIQASTGYEPARFSWHPA